MEPLASRTFDRLRFAVRYSGMVVCSSVVLGNWSLYRVFGLPIKLVLFVFLLIFKLNYRVLSFLVFNSGIIINEVIIFYKTPILIKIINLRKRNSSKLKS